MHGQDKHGIPMRPASSVQCFILSHNLSKPTLFADDTNIIFTQPNITVFKDEINIVFEKIMVPDQCTISKFKQNLLYALCQKATMQLM
jgi:hypothetical protein